MRRRRVRVTLADGDSAGLELGTALAEFSVVQWASPPDADIVLLCVRQDGEFLGPVAERLRRLRSAGFAGGVCVVAPGLGAEEVPVLLEATADTCVVGTSYQEVLAAQLFSMARLLRGDPQVGAELSHFELSANRREVRIDGEMVALRLRSFQILAYLANQVGRWVGTRELALHVFERSDDAAATIVRVHVLELRRALGVHRGIVESQRGFGYRFCLPQRKTTSGTRRRVVGLEHDGHEHDGETKS